MLDTYRPIKSFDLRPSRAFESLSMIDIIEKVKTKVFQSK